MSSSRRPLSPHLQIYRPQITSVLSVLHRATGIGAVLGMALGVWWLLSIVNGIDAYGTFYAFAKSFIGRIFLFCWLWAICYHLLNGIRHLVWDMGRGIDMDSATKSGWGVVGGSVVLTFFFWIWA